MSAWSEGIHDALTDFFTTADAGGRFSEDVWERPGGGGGWSRVLTDGRSFEKVGVNRSVVHGRLSEQLAKRLLLSGHPDATFFATGVSIVCHPHSPRVPIVHQNVRYFSVHDEDGTTLTEWFGGGIDLTPTYPEPDDAVHFHRVLKTTCAPHGDDLYARYKEECDAYFVNHHRGGEARGIGGVFFDHLGTPDSGMGIDAARRFTDSIAGVMPHAYGPLVERHRDEAWSEREKQLQLFRRGRYVEFNLVHDRGTRFGLETSARIESVLMSLPPVASWPYDPTFAPGSIEDRLMEMLKPREWA
jgi:coproporphyrinogen III oxidase